MLLASTKWPAKTHHRGGHDKWHSKVLARRTWASAWSWYRRCFAGHEARHEKRMATCLQGEASQTRAQWSWVWRCAQMFSRLHAMAGQPGLRKQQEWGEDTGGSGCPEWSVNQRTLQSGDAGELDRNIPSKGSDHPQRSWDCLLHMGTSGGFSSAEEQRQGCVRKMAEVTVWTLTFHSFIVEFRPWCWEGRKPRVFWLLGDLSGRKRGIHAGHLTDGP